MRPVSRIAAALASRPPQDRDDRPAGPSAPAGGAAGDVGAPLPLQRHADHREADPRSTDHRPGDHRIEGRDARGDRRHAERRTEDRRRTHAPSFPHGEREQLAAALRDAREAAAVAQALADRARRETEEALRTKGEFLATMSHELRTPLNAISGYTELLELGVAGPLTERQRDYLARLHASSRHLLGLVDDVLDLARIEAGRLSVAPTTFDARALVRASLPLLAQEAERRGVALDVALGDAPLPCHADEHRARQLLVALLSNAVKFTPRGGRVTVGGGAESGGVRLTVTDTGPGIAPGMRERIFEPFTQGDGSWTRATGGTGLGLAIARRLARLMGGDLTLDPSAVGAAFSLHLPADATGPHDAHGTSAPSATAPSEAARIADRLVARLGAVLEGVVARLAVDPALADLPTADRHAREDHLVALLGALAHALRAPDARDAAEGDSIRALISRRHGARRHRAGWTEAQLAREYAILDEELAAVVRQTAAHEPGLHVEAALGHLADLIGEAHAAARRGWRRAARRASIDGTG